LAFKDILGNQRVKHILHKALGRGRIPGSLLFSGPEGVGKRDVALTVAKALNCLNLRDDACEKCDHCLAINKGRFPDVLEITPEKDMIKINQIREMKQVVYLKPMTGRKKVFILRPAESMSLDAANSTLKVLEEPPEFSHIILLTENPFQLLPTIKSRCQRLAFTPVSPYDIQKALTNRGIDAKKARIMSLMSQGNVRQAMKMKWDEAEEERKLAWNIFSSLRDGRNAAAFFKKYAQYSRTKLSGELSGVLELLASFIRDLMLLKTGGDRDLLMNPDWEDQLTDYAKTGEEHVFLEWLHQIDTVIFSLQKNLNAKIIMETMTTQFMDKYYV
jgi:DNA polymerase III delta' subunit